MQNHKCRSIVVLDLWDQKMTRAYPNFWKWVYKQSNKQKQWFSGLPWKTVLLWVSFIWGVVMSSQTFVNKLVHTQAMQTCRIWMNMVVNKAFRELNQEGRVLLAIDVTWHLTMFINNYIYCKLSLNISQLILGVEKGKLGRNFSTHLNCWFVLSSTTGQNLQNI